MHQCNEGYGEGRTHNTNTKTGFYVTLEELQRAEWIAEYGWVVAVFMNQAGCVINNLGSNIQKIAFRFGSIEKRTPNCIGVWTGGFVLQILGASVDMVALGYSDQSDIGPIAALALVANIGFTRCIHKEHLFKLDVMLMFVIFLGCVICTVSAGKQTCSVNRKEIWTRLWSFEYFWTYAEIVILITTILGVVQTVAENIEKKFGKESSQYQRYLKIHRIGYPIMAG